MTAPTPGTWQVVADRSSAHFRASHFGFAHVTGTIDVISGAVEVDDAGRLSVGRAVLDVGSVNTGNPRRDKDLRTPRLLDAEHYPELQFRTDTIKDTADGWNVTGYLCVGGQDAPLTLQVTATPEGPGWRVKATGRLDRKETRMRKVPTPLIGRWIDITVDAHLAEREALQTDAFGKTGQSFMT